MGARDRVRRKYTDLTRPSPSHNLRVALEGRNLAQEKELNRPSGLREVTRGDEPVAAVVSGSAQDGHRAAAKAAPNLLGDGAAGGLHELDSADAGGNGRRVDGVHLLCA